MGSQRGRAFGQRGLRGGEQRESVEETLTASAGAEANLLDGRLQWSSVAIVGLLGSRRRTWCRLRRPAWEASSPKPLTPSKSQNPKALNPQIPPVPKP